MRAFDRKPRITPPSRLFGKLLDPEWAAYLGALSRSAGVAARVMDTTGRELPVHYDENTGNLVVVTGE